MKTDPELIIAEGEGKKVEFKERANRLDREMVAFANAAEFRKNSRYKTDSAELLPLVLLVLATN